MRDRLLTGPWVPRATSCLDTFFRAAFLLAAFLLLCGALLPGVAAAHATADTIYVDKGANGTEDGTSWANAYTSLQDALQAARANGEDDAVWVASGTYHPDEGSSANADDRSESFRVESGIDLRGHFSGDEQSLGDRTLARGGPKTILSGDIQQDGTQSNNAYTVLRIIGGSASELHIEGGAANGSGPQRRGGGAYVTGGTLHHAVLSGNRARRGAALFATGSPALEVLRVTGNHATEAGALYFSGDASTAEHLTVADNTAGSGPSGMYFIGSDAAIEDLAAGPGATHAVAERIQVTFNPVTVGNSLYEGGSYSGELDYTVSTGDTTFTTSGSTTADVPISDGDNLEISHGDSEYISTFAVNNTDTEQPPFQVSGFPDEPDYQSSSTVSIPKSDVVNQYQIRGIPSTSPEGKDTKSTYGGDLGAGRWTTRDGYDEIKGIITTTRIDNGDDVPQSVIDKMSEEFSASTSQMSFLPITQTQKTFSEVEDVFNNRGVNFNYTSIDGSVASNNTTVSQGYAERARSTYSENAATLDIREEVYESFTGANNLPVYTSDGFNNDAKWIPRVIYSLESQNTF
ncbi:hypothetical protein [Salinibacter ruber]|uniref:hypothetical protein n=1 Tax=Salinibacter ruber TaxID=146919 RepID=UPI002169E083|nr:hypothetical protein [Salinibacter ruber]MCS4142600.1 hypothetical protein [Salinibacter ruber]